jgi:hypothetical protein
MRCMTRTNQLKASTASLTPFPKLWQFRPLRLKVVCNLA